MDNENANGNGNANALVPLFQKEHAKKAGRDRNGRWVKGVSGNTIGRPRESLAELCRGITDRHKLVHILGQIGRGSGRYSRVDAGVRVRAIQIILAYGYGSPSDVFGSVQGQEMRVSFIKRVIGIPEDAV